ncbi:MAG: hypothetical protein RI101_06100 [Nitrospira sp.]|jgi:hypothetical protein|nr:hypothetical protein [Nitrospira sp.]
MLKRTLTLLVLALAQWGCDINYGENLSPFNTWNLEEVRSRLEREKREFLKIEEIQVGNGAIASWGRRLKAEIEVRYADDGTTIFKGPLVTYVGFEGLLASYLPDRFMLSDSQHGIQLGLNGMAVGGKRRVVVDQTLVCDGPDAWCHLLRPERHFVNEIKVRKSNLIVEATLTESCAPIRFRWRAGSSFTLIDISAGCRTKSEPKVGGSDWHIY